MHVPICMTPTGTFGKNDLFLSVYEYISLN